MRDGEKFEISEEAEGSSGDTLNSDVLEVSDTQTPLAENNSTIPEAAPKETKCAPLLRIEFRSIELYTILEQEISAAVESVFQSCRPEQRIEMRPGSDDRSVEIYDTTVSKTVDADESLFVVDSTPTKSTKNDCQIPSYKKVMNKVYEGQTPETTPSSLAKRPRVKTTCWNCEGDHGLKDCKQPRNYNRIRQKKEEFQKKTERYHADMEQKYGHFVPGQLSRELCNALGLSSRDLPLHIYKMRVHGYPPGWLEEAKVTLSGLQLFDSNGDVVQHADDSDGQVDNVRRIYDVRKILAFPGFNEPPPRRVFDDSKFYNVPPYSDEFSRAEMIRQLEGTLVDGYRRKKLRLNGETNVLDTSPNRELIDMDAMELSPELATPLQEVDELEDGELMDETTPEVEESVIILEAPIEVISLDDTISSALGTPSTSLRNLEQKQQTLDDQEATNITPDSSFMNDILENDKLYAAMQTPSAASPPQLPPASRSLAIPPCSPTTPQPAPLPVEAPPPPAFTPDDDIPAEKTSEPVTLDLGDIVMRKVPHLDEPTSGGLEKMSLGTPILQPFTPYSSLPSGEAFSKGVSDVINFENLPNSTGKYKQMKSLLTQVRQKISDHMRDTD